MRIALAFFSLFLAAACGEKAVAIRYLRSDTYEFSRQDRRTIGGIAESAAAEARRYLRALPPHIKMTVRPGSDVIAETGETATVTPPDGMVVTIDPSRPGGVGAVAQAWLRAAMLHEFHHLVRLQATSPQTIVDHAVLEGMATVFERDVAGVDAPWGGYPADVQAWADELLRLPADAPRKEWLFDHPDGRRWVAYKVGAFWMDRARAKTGKSAAELAATPVAEILTLAGFQPSSR